MNMDEQKARLLDNWQDYIDAVKEDMTHNKVDTMVSLELCDRCGDFLQLVMKDDGDIKYFCPKDRVSVGWESIALRGVN